MAVGTHRGKHGLQSPNSNPCGDPPLAAAIYLVVWRSKSPGLAPHGHVHGTRRGRQNVDVNLATLEWEFLVHNVDRAVDLRQS